MSECVVYWLHDAYCTHVQKHGYVGISTNFWRRLARHQKDKRFPLFDWSIVYIGTREKCLEIEYDLRPTWGVGWNKAEGGEIGCGTQPKSLEQKAKMSAAAKARYTDLKERELAKEYQKGIHDHRGEKNPRFGIVMSDEVKKNISVGRKGKALGNQNWRKRKSVIAQQKEN